MCGYCCRFICLIAAVTIMPYATAGDRVLLNANFDHETIGAAPGLGGAIAGESVYSDTTAIIGGAVANTSFTSPNLQIRDLYTQGAEFARFEFFNSEEIINGTVQIRARILNSGSWLPIFYVREQGASGQSFLNLSVTTSVTGALIADASVTALGDAGYLTPNQEIVLEIDQSPDQKLVSIRLNGIAQIDARPYTMSTVRGIGSFMVGEDYGSSATSDDVMRVDNIRVVACTSSVFADCLMVDGFDL